MKNSTDSDARDTDSELDNNHSEITRRKALQGIGGSTALLLTGRNVAGASNPSIEVLSGKRVFVDPSLETEYTFSQNVPEPEPEETDLALIATNTSIDTSTVYGFLNDTTPVSIIGGGADISAFDYLTEGEQEIDGHEINNTIKQEMTTSSQLEVQAADEIDRAFGYEIVEDKVAESTTLYPTEKSINSHVNFGDTGAGVGTFGEPSPVARQILQDIESNIIEEEGNLQTMETEEPNGGSHPTCDTGDLSCAGVFNASARNDGNEWNKRVIGSYMKGEDSNDDWWAIATRLRVTPNRSPRIRKHYNSYVEREIELGVQGVIDESQPHAADDQENISYQLSVGTDNVGSATWSRTIAEAPMSISWEEWNDSVEHRFDSFADYNKKESVAPEPMYAIRDQGHCTYDYDDEIQWLQKWALGTKEHLSGSGWWLWDE